MIEGNGYLVCLRRKLGGESPLLQILLPRYRVAATHQLDKNKSFPVDDHPQSFGIERGEQSELEEKANLVEEFPLFQKVNPTSFLECYRFVVLTTYQENMTK